MLEMLILKCLTIEPMHGYGIAQYVQWALSALAAWISSAWPSARPSA